MTIQDIKRAVVQDHDKVINIGLHFLAQYKNLSLVKVLYCC